MTENTDKDYINSICNNCQWRYHCGEDNKVKCTYEDNVYNDYRFDFTEFTEDDQHSEDNDFRDDNDLYAERITKVKRRSFNREWEDYMNYITYDDWRKDYDC